MLFRSYNVFYAYDFVEKKGTTLDGEGWPRVSIDGTKYMTFYCPFTYTYNSIRLPVSVNEEYSSGNSLLTYPNPASDFITIQLSNKGLQPFAAGDKVQIFDILGIEVISVGTGLDLSTQPNDLSTLRINVSHLPAGVYFIRMGDRVEKFVKK